MAARLDTPTHHQRAAPNPLRTVLPPSRRGLSRPEAASYIGVGVSKFDEMVDDGRMPKAKRIDGRVVWDLKKLDDAFDALPDDGAEADAIWDSVEV